MRRYGWFLLGLLLLVSGCAPATPSPMPTATVSLEPPTPINSPTPTPEPMAALVNGTPILLVDYERQVASYEASLAAQGIDASTPEGQRQLAEARSWILDQMIEQVLIEQAAAQAGVSVSEDEVTVAIQSLESELGAETLAARLAQEGLTPETLRIELKRQMLVSKMASRVIANVPSRVEHVRARHILVATQADAERVLARLAAGEDFAQLAMAVSLDVNTRINGGDLGYFPRGVLSAPEVEAAAFSLEPGAISQAVQSALGYHIIQVLDKSEREVSPEHLVLLQDKALRDWLAALWAQADIQRLVNLTP